jgi:hypothetical protein
LGNDEKIDGHSCCAHCKHGNNYGKKNVAMPWIKLASINNNNTSYFETRYIKRSVGNLSIVSRFFFFLQIKIENEADELKVCEILGSKVKFWLMENLQSIAQLHCNLKFLPFFFYKIMYHYFFTLF